MMAPILPYWPIKEKGGEREQRSAKGRKRIQGDSAVFSHGMHGMRGGDVLDDAAVGGHGELKGWEELKANRAC